MKRIRRVLVILAVAAAVNAAPAASAGPFSDLCEDVNMTLQGYGWHGDTCLVEDPTDTP